jgi:chemotaxis protein methyltransferase CheR
MTPDRAADVGRFRTAVARALGLQFDDGKLGFLAGVLERRLAATRLDAAPYLDRLGKGQDAREIAALAPELTVSETYFFRHAAQFRALARALADRVTARRSERRLRLLSAGCASGEEAYSLAMAARDVVPASWDIGVRGIDLNATVIEKARRGRYTEWALRETPPAMERRWFTRHGRHCELDVAIRAAVRFDVRNLVDEDAELWAPGSYDIVFIRNVLMYFEPAQARVVLARVERALRPGGFLFLGHAETLRGLSTGFALRHTDEAFYYQRLDGTPDGVSPWDEPAAMSAATPGATPAIDEDWIAVVQRTAARIERLAEGGSRSAERSAPATPRPPAPANGTPAAPAPVRVSWDLAPVRACLRDERYGDAAAAIAALPADAAADPDVLLHVAVVETHRGRLEQAEAACRCLLDADTFNAGAHYVLALCRDAEGEPARAEHHDQVAIYLDPAFAMPHLHLGLLARRRGDRGTARRTLEHAARLLQGEAEPRLLLFGGGFGRESLVALCRTEIARLEAPA